MTKVREALENFENKVTDVVAEATINHCVGSRPTFVDYALAELKEIMLGCVGEEKPIDKLHPLDIYQKDGYNSCRAETIKKIESLFE